MEKEIWKQLINRHGVFRWEYLNEEDGKASPMPGSRPEILRNTGFEYIGATHNELHAKLSQKRNNTQWLGSILGGVLTLAAECLANVAANLSLPEGHWCIAQSLNSVYIRAAKNEVTLIAKPLSLGKKVHVWRVDAVDTEGRVCSSYTFNGVVIAAPK